MKNIQALQLKSDLMENANNTFPSNIQQEQTQKDGENKQLEEKPARLEAELNRATDNDLKYDSPDDDNDNDNDINYDSAEDDNNNDNNDINHDTECSDEEEKNTKHNTRNPIHQDTR